MEIQKSLEEQTKEIQILCKKWVENCFEIGGKLRQIRDSKSYKHQYGTFEAYINANFDFTERYAYNFMDIHEKFNEKLKSFQLLSEFGIRALILSLQVPDDYIEEMVDELEQTKKINPKTNVQQLAKVVKRFSKQSGSEPRHQSALNREDAKEEHILKLRREALSFHNRFNEIEQAQIALKEGIKKWESSALKYPELAQQVKEMRSLWNDL